MELPTAFTFVLDQGLESIYSLREVFEPTVVLGKKKERKKESNG